MKLCIKTKNGVFEGIQKASGVTLFAGIPFARKPIGALRWKAPQQLDDHEGYVKANDYGPAPWQNFEYDLFGNPIPEAEIPEMSEACLRLNIWTADITAQDKPVLVWIYGGAYISGYNFQKEYIGENFVKQHPDIIVVAMNYRLGILGSLNLSAVTDDPDYRFSNNLAILDQQMALKWINENIASFGGDPKRITLFGHSAGSNAITNHLANDGSKTLFQQAICESSFFIDMGLTSWEKSLSVAECFMKISGADTMDKLLALTPEEIMAAQKKLIQQDLKFPGKCTKLFSPVRDGIVLAKDPFELLLSGITEGKKIIVGTSQGEFDQMYVGKSVHQAKELTITKNRQRLEGRMPLVDTYFQIEEGQNINEREAAMDLQADLYTRIPATILARAAAMFSEVYFFYYQLYDRKNRLRAPHGFMNAYIFGTTMDPEVPSYISRRLMDTWAAFVRTGNPNHSGIPEWPLFNTVEDGTMIMDDTWKVAYGFRIEQYKLLAPLFEEADKLLMLSEGRLRERDFYGKVYC